MGGRSMPLTVVAGRSRPQTYQRNPGRRGGNGECLRDDGLAGRRGGAGRRDLAQQRGIMTGARGRGRGDDGGRQAAGGGVPAGEVARLRVGLLQGGSGGMNGCGMMGTIGVFVATSVGVAGATQAIVPVATTTPPRVTVTTLPVPGVPAIAGAAHCTMFKRFSTSRRTEQAVTPPVLICLFTDRSTLFRHGDRTPGSVRGALPNWFTGVVENAALL